jgi:DNA-binding winged helix-turn-helix (wHTH) protein
MDAKVPVPSAYVFGPFRLEPQRLRLTRDGVELTTTPRLFDTLHYLVQNAGRVIGKDEMLNVLWPGRFADEANLSQAISGVRKLLGPEGEFVITVPRQGFRFVAKVEPEFSPLPTPSDLMSAAQNWRKRASLSLLCPARPRRRSLRNATCSASGFGVFPGLAL